MVTDGDAVTLHLMDGITPGGLPLNTSSQRPKGGGFEPEPIVPTPKATGGTISDAFEIDGTNYFSHVFTSTDAQTFSLSEDVTADILIIGGGGGGHGMSHSGSHGGSGGGAGGFVFYKGQSLTTGDYNIQVGSGGDGSEGNNAAAQKGGDTTFTSLQTAFGGGAVEGTGNNQSGSSGGSGSGGSNDSGSAGGGTANQGNAGSNATWLAQHGGTINQNAGNGGGAAEAGPLPSVAQRGGNGYREGDSVYNFTDGSTVVLPQMGGPITEFAGGGQSGNWNATRETSTPSIGGGGVTGSWGSSNANRVDAIPPVENSGSGGAGGSNDPSISGAYNDSVQRGTDGADGIVIIRYQV